MIRRSLVAIALVILVAGPAQASPPRFARCMQRAAHMQDRERAITRAYCFMRRAVDR